MLGGEKKDAHKYLNFTTHLKSSIGGKIAISEPRASISKHMPQQVLQIPGFFFDPVKKRYFKVDTTSTLSHQYTDTNIKAQEEEQARKKKRLTQEQRTTMSFPKIYYDHLDVSNRLNFRKRTQAEKTIRRHLFDTIKVTNSIQTPSSVQLKSINSFGTNNFIVSDLVNIHLYAGGHNDSNTCPESNPKLMLSRYDKNTSLLRSFDTFESSPLVIRTWLGSFDEPSEVEISSFTTDGELVGSKEIFSPRDSFNKSLYNTSTENLIICCNKSLKLYNMRDSTINSDSVRFKGDALTIDNKDQFVHYVGFRNGDVRIWDLRSSQSKLISPFESSQVRSVINLKKAGEYGVICSSIGSNIKLLDLRMGKSPVRRSYRSNKNVYNVFGENMEMITDSEFFVQSKNLIEVFNVSDEEPMKVITEFEREGEPISFAKWMENYKSLYTLSNSGIQCYNSLE